MASCWGITSGSAGMAAQVHALATALGLNPEMKTIVIRKPFVWLPNRFYTGFLEPLVVPYAIARGSDKLTAPWPEIVISCGRRGAIAALGLRHRIRAEGGSTKFIHIQDPHTDPKYFDLIVAMAHDKITGANVIKTRFALHTVTPAALASASARFYAQFSDYPRPYISVLLGGSTNKYTLVPADMHNIAELLQRALDTTSASLLITPSRRTGEDNIALLQKKFAGNKRVYIYNFSDENPYMGLLALGDTIFVTNDSVNMMSEAYATGKPLYILPLPGHRDTKPARFADALIRDAIAREFEGAVEHWDHRVENEMGGLAAEIRKRLPLP